jgi:hypothetical protein
LILSRTDFIPYEMIGNSSNSVSCKEMECINLDPKEVALRLLMNDTLEFLGLELYNPFFLPSHSEDSFSVELNLPVHFNYQNAQFNGTYKEITLSPPVYFLKSSSNTPNSPESSSVQRIFQFSYLGNENKNSSSYFHDLSHLIQNNTYESISSLPSYYLPEKATVSIPIGDLNDSSLVSAVSTAVLVLCLSSLIVHLLYLIGKTLLDAGKKSPEAEAQITEKKKEKKKMK